LVVRRSSNAVWSSKRRDAVEIQPARSLAREVGMRAYERCAHADVGAPPIAAALGVLSENATSTGERSALPVDARD
jgi:hypothetical protein